MLEIRKTAAAFDEKDLMELEGIMVDNDKDDAMRFLKKCVYDRILHSQQCRLKSLLDSSANPVEGFISRNK